MGYNTHTHTLYCTQIMKEEFGCVEDFKLVDVRLIISILAVAFAATALAYDYLIPFPASKIVLAVCAIRYPH